MSLNTSFKGRIIQIVDALDFGDAVSNQVIALDIIFKQFGLHSEIYSEFAHSLVEKHRAPLGSLAVTDKDVVIVHFCIGSNHMVPCLDSFRCTKILYYHNITPHEYFPQGSRSFELCVLGRKQLPSLVKKCHYFWSVSAFNQQELLDLGAPANRCSVVPIAVRAETISQMCQSREVGKWLFIGRIVKNKDQLSLIRLFHRVRIRHKELARDLFLVGSFDPNDPYASEVKAEIESLGLSQSVHLLGKVEQGVISSLLQSSSVFVSLSKHEGFCVPVIEAANAGLPVAALATTALPETMGFCPGLAQEEQELEALIVALHKNNTFATSLQRAQALNAQRFTTTAVAEQVALALAIILPRPNQHKTISIVICTHNRADLLGRCLDYLQHQTTSGYEVIVVDNASTDETAELIRSYGQRIKSATVTQLNLSKARNAGIAMAAGDLIGFIDDDALPFDNWGELCLTEFNERPLCTAACGGPVYYAGSLTFQAQDNVVNRFGEAICNAGTKEIGSAEWYRYPTGTNSVFRADILRDAGGFDEQFDYYLDESELSLRLQLNGFIVGYTSRLIVRHEFAQSLNRRGRWEYNWRSICTNTAYFAAAYSGKDTGDLRRYLHERFKKERVGPLEIAYSHGEISHEYLVESKRIIVGSVDAGLKEAERFPKTTVFEGSCHAPFGGYASAKLSSAPRRPLHICIITKEFPPFAPGGGVGTMYYHLASELILMGCKVSIVTPAERATAHTAGPFSVLPVQSEPLLHADPELSGMASNLNWSIAALKAVSRLHRAEQIDIVESALWDTEALAVALSPRPRCPKVVVRLVTPVPVSARLSDWNLTDRQLAFFRTAERQFISKADAVAPISKSIQSTVCSEYSIEPDPRWYHLPCGISYWPAFDVNHNYNSLDALTSILPNGFLGSKLVLFLGRLEGRKGIDTLLLAAKDFLTHCPDARLVIAGKDLGGYAEKAGQIAGPQLVDRIALLGEVTDHVRESLMSAAHCLVFPSKYESFGLVPLEAFKHGLPVVAARAGAIPEVVEDGKGGLLFEPDSPSDLSLKVRQIVTDPALHSRLAKAAKTVVRDSFSARKAAMQSCAMYDNVLHVSSPK
jgi:glycosyltransferase involved in cell wall biosynthesis